ncbi:MAG: bifunctional nicotinamidase/pyrazinamidase [Simkaniaceae bacterium]
MTALLIVDVQNDFLPSGSLAVDKGDEIIPFINQLMKKDFDLIVATKDWHPEDHCSFQTNKGEDQASWPVHGVQGTMGAKFPNTLDQEKIKKIFYKGTDSRVDSYSAFFDQSKKRSTALHEYLQDKKIHHLTVVGLATDYCILYTVLDALQLGYEVCVLQKGVRAVNLKPEDGENALKMMGEKGAKID